MDNNQENIEIDLQELLFVLLGKIWILIGGAVMGGLLALLYTVLCVTPMYSSSSSLYIMSKTTTLTSLTDVQLGTQLTQDYMVLAKSRTVVETVIKEMDLDMTYQEFLNHVTVSNENNTRILTLTVTNEDPYMAKMIVDKYAEITASKTASIMDTQIPNIVDEGVIEKNPVSPNTAKNVAVGAACIFVLVAAVIVVQYLMDDSIKGADDVEKYLGLTNLGNIPVYSDDKKQGSKKRGNRKKKNL